VKSNNNKGTGYGSGKVDELVNEYLRQCAEGLVAQVLAAESARYLDGLGGLRDELGRDAVVRNGFQPERYIETGIGKVAVRFPKLRCRTGNAAAFRSSIVPRYVRRTCATDRESMWRYLYGMACCDLNQILAALLGSWGAHVARLVPDSVRSLWVADCMHKRRGPLAEPPIVELWVECIEADPAWVAARGCLIVVIGADRSGGLRLLALEHVLALPDSLWTGVVRGLVARGLQWPERINLGAAARGFAIAREAADVGRLEPAYEPIGESEDAFDESRYAFAASPIPT
jgi:putative transposase